MAVAPNIAELEATITRMEAWFDADPRAVELMADYHRLRQRFTADLTDPRDVLLSRAAALMMIKYRLE